MQDIMEYREYKEGGTPSCITIRLSKDIIDGKIDQLTHKRNQATPGYSESASANARVGDAVTSDTTEDNDGYIVAGYRDRRNAEVRKALAYCIQDDEVEDGEVFTNVDPYEGFYDYVIQLPDGMNATRSLISSIASRMEDYIVRGTLYDWYLGANIQPTDTPETLDALLEDISSAFRGKSYTKRPLQPFGPREREWWKHQGR